MSLQWRVHQGQIDRVRVLVHVDWLKGLNVLHYVGLGSHDLVIVTQAVGQIEGQGCSWRGQQLHIRRRRSLLGLSLFISHLQVVVGLGQIAEQEERRIGMEESKGENEDRYWNESFFSSNKTDKSRLGCYFDRVWQVLLALYNYAENFQSLHCFLILLSNHAFFLCVSPAAQILHGLFSAGSPLVVASFSHIAPTIYKRNVFIKSTTT